ncbi:MAG: amino acid--tRNA ligase-related protein [Syntrophorhabdaceae bacterium]
MTDSKSKMLSQLLQIRHEMFKETRNFFYERGYIEVETASLMRTAPPDPHIDPLEVHVGTKGPYFLHTSPEMGMKKILRWGHRRIFQICKVFRVEEFCEIHNTEFTMLEWYREGTGRDVITETCDLVEYIANRLSIPDPGRFRQPYRDHELDQLFRELIGFDPFPLDRNSFFEALKKYNFAGIDNKDDWNSLFFKAYILKIEPYLKKPEPCIITGWPSMISTMAKRRQDKPNMVERFELYSGGLEIANGYAELLDPLEQRERFLHDNEERLRMNKTQFPIDEIFLESLRDIKGPVAGVSIGMDRLLMSFVKEENIENVLADRTLV